jgi:hypothetical protein
VELIKFDYSLLRGRIIEKYGKCAAFADAIGFKRNSLSYRLRNGTPWKDYEMLRACELLDIAPEELYLYFLTPKVLKSRTA